MAVSGALAGMVGINEVLGYRYRYYDGFSDNYGFTGIAVALLGRNHPVGVILAALLFAALQHGGIYVDGFSEHVTKDIVQVLQGIIILFVAAEGFLQVVCLRRRGSVETFESVKRMRDIFTLSLICLNDPARDSTRARRAWRTVFRTLGRDQYRARRKDARRSFHCRGGDLRG